MIIRRYLFREITYTFLAVILVVLLIALSNKLVRLLSQAALGGISPQVVFEVIFFQIPELLAFLLPLALFLAILLSYSRLFIDNEIPVMLAGGLSWQRLLAINLSFGLIIMLLTGVLTLYIAPKAAELRQQLLRTEGPMLLMQTMTPGRFHALDKEKVVLYVTAMSSDRKTLDHVFLAEQPKDSTLEKNWSLITAQSGKIESNEKSGEHYFTLIDGQRYNGIPGEMDYSILSFKIYRRLLEANKTQEGVYFHRNMPTHLLWKDENISNKAELQWRLSLPLCAPLLALFALPLSQVAPREGRFGRLLIGIFIAIIYFNLLTLSKRFVATGALSPKIGVWWVHLLLLALGLIYFAKISGYWQQGLYTMKKRFSK